MSLKLITSTSPSGASSVDFTSGIDSTYDEYVFYYVDLIPSVATQPLSFQVNASGGSGFNETMTTTFFDADHTESGTGTLNYEAADDQGNGTSYQKLTRATGGDADATCAGVLHLFNPASTTRIKHFLARSNEYFSASPRILDNFVSGWINTTTAITEVSFKFNTGTITGNIYMFGVK